MIMRIVELSTWLLSPSALANQSLVVDGKMHHYCWARAGMQPQTPDLLRKQRDVRDDDGDIESIESIDDFSMGVIHCISTHVTFVSCEMAFRL